MELTTSPYLQNLASLCILENEAGWRKSQLVRIRDAVECRDISAFKGATLQGCPVTCLDYCEFHRRTVSWPGITVRHFGN